MPEQNDLAIQEVKHRVTKFVLKEKKPVAINISTEYVTIFKPGYFSNWFHKEDHIRNVKIDFRGNFPVFKGDKTFWVFYDTPVKDLEPFDLEYCCPKIGKTFFTKKSYIPPWTWVCKKETSPYSFTLLKASRIEETENQLRVWF